MAKTSDSWFLTSSFLLHFAAIGLFMIGVVVAFRKGPQARGCDRIIRLGPVFFAVPLAVFGMQHFSATDTVILAVPHWMPGRLFWVYFVGSALVAACLSIVTGAKIRLSAMLVGIMLCLFVLLIYLPLDIRHPRDRFIVASTLRDLSLSGGAFALAATQPEWDNARGARWLATLGRFFFGVPMVFFGIEHFPHPDFAPGVPLELMMPPWIPGHVAWAWFTGTVLVVAGLSLLFNKGARLAATCLGITYLLLVIFIYLPMDVVHPSIEISGELDYVANTLAMAGASLLVAGTFARKSE